MMLQDALQQPDWWTALASAVVSTVISMLSAWTAYAQFRRRYRLEDRTEAVLRRLLRDDPDYKKRKFETIHTFVPLEPQKLREALIRAGAVRIPGEEEYWGLVENHEDRVFPKKSRHAKKSREA